MLQSNNKYKTMLCKHFNTSGQCPVGLRCHFAHGQQELRSFTDPLPEQALINPQDPYSLLLQQGQGSTTNFKTAVCKNFEMGICKYGQSCTYAHGQHELRAPTLNTGYMQQQTQVKNYMMQEMSQKITQYQLQYLIYHMDQQKSTDSMVQQKLKIATELWQVGNIQSCAQELVLNEIIYRPDVTPQEKVAYEKFLADAQGLAANYMLQLQQQQMSGLTFQ